MPKGVGILIAALVVVIAGVGGWLWYDSGTSPFGKKASVGAASSSASKLPAARPGGPTPVPFPRGVDPKDDYEPGELVVLDPPQNFATAIRNMGYTVAELTPLNGLTAALYRLRVPPGTSVENARRDLAAAFPGLTVDANHRYDVQQAQAPGDFKENMARAAIGWAAAKPTCGQGIKLGMIDAGVDVKHPALVGQTVEFRSFHKEDRRPGPNDHGTAVAGIMVGRSDWGGLLPGASLKAANMFERDETGNVVGNAVGLLKAMNWMAEENVDVVNMSVAGSDNKAVRAAFDKARRARLVVVAAAGNWGREDMPAYPAAYDDVVAVTAINHDKGIYTQANRGSYVDFAAPGVNIYTAVPSGGKLQSGTSFAAPYISVLMAVAVKGGAKKDPDALIATMQKGVIDLGAPGKDSTYGWGLVSQQTGC